MNYEIEKKFLIGNFDGIYNSLNDEFGEGKRILKAGFWWCNNYASLDNIMEITAPKILKKNVLFIKEIGEFNLDVQDYQYVRLRINDFSKYLITFKIKQTVNTIEQNIEFEYEPDKNTFKRVAEYLKEAAQIFYYNIKETYEYTVDDFKIELSKFNDLRNAYMEIETTGSNKNKLTEKLNTFITRFSKYNLTDETRSYHTLSLTENEDKLAKTKLSQYSREAIKELNKYI